MAGEDFPGGGGDTVGGVGGELMDLVAQVHVPGMQDESGNALPLTVDVRAQILNTLAAFEVRSPDDIRPDTALAMMADILVAAHNQNADDQGGQHE